MGQELEIGSTVQWMLKVTDVGEQLVWLTYLVSAGGMVEVGLREGGWAGMDSRWVDGWGWGGSGWEGMGDNGRFCTLPTHQGTWEEVGCAKAANRSAT